MSTNFGFEPDVKDGEYYFISYNSEDIGRVGEYALKLHKMGVPLWYDYGLEPGEAQWEAQIADHISKCKALIMFITQGIFQKDQSYVKLEYDIATTMYGNRKTVYIVLLDEINEKEVRQQYQFWWAKLKQYQYMLRPSTDKIIRAIKFKAPAPAPNSAPKPTPAPAPQPAPPKPPAQVTKIERVKQRVNVGDIVEFGRYPQGKRGEVEPLEWRVLETDGDTALLLTEKCVDCLPYNEKRKSVTWETCTLRKWMNNDFINKAFNSSEQISLVVSNNTNPDNPLWDTEGGKDTQDKVFALSIPEAQKYFADSESRMAYATDYAKSKKCYVSDSLGTSWWWLRSPGDYTLHAANVDYDGDIYSYGYYVHFDIVAVRLACRIHL